VGDAACVSEREGERREEREETDLRTAKVWF
jgi:hypothetical protein